MRKLLMLVMIIALIVPAGQAFAADDAEKINVSFAPLHYVIDGVEYAAPVTQKGFINSEGNTYVPIRFVAYILQKSITWDGGTSKVTIADPVTDDERSAISTYLTAQEIKNSDIKRVDQKTVTSTPIEVYTRKVTYEFDGQLVEENVKTPGLFYNNSIYVPLRFIYETLGYPPAFDQSKYLIEANSEAYSAIVDPYEVLIDEKKNACQKSVLALNSKFNEKKATITAEETAAIIADADAILADCRTEVDTILVDLKEELTDAGKSANIVDKYEEEINTMEKLAKSIINNHRTK